MSEQKRQSIIEKLVPDNKETNLDIDYERGCYSIRRDGNPSKITFINQQGFRRALPYNLLTCVDYDNKTGDITLFYANKIVTLRGRNLIKLYEYISRDIVSSIRALPSDQFEDEQIFVREVSFDLDNNQ